MLLKAFLLVTLLTACMCFVVYYGIFNDLQSVDIGYHHYAEFWNTSRLSTQFHRRVSRSWLPRWLKMPMNSIVNAGYVVVGAYWCAITTNNVNAKLIGPTDSFLFYMFNLMSIFYAPIQALRILTQIHGFGVLDQWYTLPIFMWTVVWSFSIIKGFNRIMAVLVMFASVSSYFSTLSISTGFDICLAIHILLAVCGGVFVYMKYPCMESRAPFLLTLLMCAGFVVLKVADLELPKFHPVFRKISGHFLSKICDFLQVHFVNRYLLAITLHRNYRIKEKSE